MKKIISTTSVLLLLSTSFVGVFAASGATTTTTKTSTSSKVDHFTVTTNPTSTKVGEAIDLTVTAVDSAGNTKKDYAGDIYIAVDNDSKATVPFTDGFQFKAEDLGSKTFSKGLSFTKTGKMKVVVLDIENDQLEGSVDVTVTDGTEGNAGDSTGDITIISPDNGMTISDNKVTVSGTTKKNSKVKFFLNGTEMKDLETQTDDKGAFTTEMKDLTQSTNIIKVKALDGTDKIIAESSDISINIETSGPLFKSLSVIEGAEAPSGSEINLTLLADSGLSEVTATLGEVVQPLIESTTSPGTYEGKVTLPSIEGDYSIDINLKSSLGKTTVKKSAATIKAFNSNIFMNIKAITSDTKVNFTFDVTPDKPEYTKFKFKYGTSSETLKTAGDTQNKESITFEKEKIKSSTGTSYSWYVSGLDSTVGKYYFQINPVDKDGKDISGVQSEIVEVDFGLNSAGTCMISNVSGLKATKNGDVVELSWDALPEATDYNVYKKGEDGNFTLIESVKINKYTLNLSSDKIKYDEFAIKAACTDGEKKIESNDYSNVTKVQTGPAQLAFLLGVSLLIGFFLVRRRYSK
ncbi:MAG: hypothetical protein PHZ26_03280 [Candidatus Gracilibacteria bacterium]|nr:hypothetical protein [Candidatus Gracilibacteria bacterium]MDD2908750.1 hypothetical protein [Candidatus Gracilibacteria bacterium]